MHIGATAGRRGEEVEDFQVGAERFNRYTLFVETMGTKENPTLIPSAEPARIVGCAGGCAPVSVQRTCMWGRVK